jgi:hypothetical protein
MVNMIRRSVLAKLGQWTGALFLLRPKSGFAAARVVRVSDFGVTPAGNPVTNDLGMRKALATAERLGGAQLAFAAGTYNFSVTSPWQLGAETHFIGAGKSQTVLKRIDRKSVNWIQTLNSRGGNRFSGFTAIGNSQSFVHGDGAFLYCQLDKAAKAHHSRVQFDNVELQNFRGAGWIFLIMLGPCHFDFRDIVIDGNCSFVSRTGNARGANDIGVLASVLNFQGNIDADGSAGRIRNVRVGPAVSDIPHIKSFCVIWGGVKDVVIDHPVIERCGTIGIAPNSGAYAIMVGNETVGAPNPDQVNILGPTIKACQSVGVYFVNWGGIGGTNRFDGRGGYIANVTDSENGTLPKGAVTATDGETRLEIRNVKAVNCVSAVDIPLANRASVLIDGVDATRIHANQFAIRVGMQGGLPSNRPASEIEIRNVRVRSTAPFVTGIKFTTERNMGKVTLGGVIDIDVPYIGISAFAEIGEASVTPFDQFTWAGNATFANCSAGAIVLRNNISPMTILATIRIQRGEQAGMRDTRIKADNAAALSVMGSVMIDDVRTGDHAAWSARMIGVRHRGQFKPDAVRFSNSDAGVKWSTGSVGVK